MTFGDIRYDALARLSRWSFVGLHSTTLDQWDSALATWRVLLKTVLLLLEKRNTWPSAGAFTTTADSNCAVQYVGTAQRKNRCLSTLMYCTRSSCQHSFVFGAYYCCIILLWRRSVTIIQHTCAQAKGGRGRAPQPASRRGRDFCILLSVQTAEAAVCPMDRRACCTVPVL